MNSPDAYDSASGLAAVHMSVEDLLSFMNDFPALLWRIEIAKSRIEFLNNNYIVSNGLDGKLLLKNIRYQQDVVVPEDAYLIGAFMESVKKGKTAATIFRARCAENRIAWLKITGATNTWDPRYYYGFLLNVTDTVEQIKAIMDKDVNIQSLIDDTDNAALVLDYDSRRLRLIQDLVLVRDDIEAIMRVAFDSALASEKYDVIMFSDVHVRKNQVYVYYAGNQPMPLEQGHRFAYSGTIAEDISRFQLSHLTVDDTQESIKPIDWALFVPQGIRSYLAKPFFSRGALRTVLIVCSRRPHTFSGVTVGDFEDLLEPINEAVKMWRQSGRR